MANRTFRPSVAFACFLANSAAPAALLTCAVLALPALTSSAQALTQDVVLDGIKLDFPAKADGNGSISIKKVSFEGTNLSKDEVAKLFSLATTPEEARALVAKLTAGKVSIPEAVINFENTQGSDVTKGTVTLRDLLVTKVDQGKAAKVSFGGAEIAAKTNDVDAAKGSVGSYIVDDMDFSSLLSALKAGDMSKGMVKYSKVSFAGLDVFIVDKDTPAGSPGGNMVHVKMGAATGTANFDGELFRKGSGELQSLSIEFPKASATGKALIAFGYDKLDIGMKASASYDTAAKKMAIDDFTISGVGAGVLAFKGLFGSVDPAFFSGDKDLRLKAVMLADFSAMTLKFVNSGLAEKGFAFAAATQKKSAEALKAEASGMAKAALPGILGPDLGKKVADAVVAFLAAPKSLSIDIKAKGGALKFSDLAKAAGPQDVLPKIDLSVLANQ